MMTQSRIRYKDKENLLDFTQEVLFNKELKVIDPCFKHLTPQDL